MSYRAAGIHYVTLTPFAADGSIDVPGTRRLLRRMLLGGCDGIVTGGLVSQIQFLSEAERRQMVKIAVEEAGDRYPVTAGIEGPTDKAIEEAIDAKKAGVQALMLHPPLIDFLDPASAFAFLYPHYKAIADAADLPVVLFEFPRHHPSYIAPEQFARLCKEIEQTVAYKAGNAGGADFTRTAQAVRSARPSVKILGAVAQDVLPAAINGDIDGMTAGVAAVITEPMIAAFKAAKEGDWPTAIRIHKTILQPVGEAIYGWPKLDAWFHARYKYAAKMLGRVEHAEPRRPWLPLPQDQIDKLRNVLETSGLLEMERQIVPKLDLSRPVHQQAPVPASARI